MKDTPPVAGTASPGPGRGPDVAAPVPHTQGHTRVRSTFEALQAVVIAC